MDCQFYFEKITVLLFNFVPGGMMRGRSSLILIKPRLKHQHMPQGTLPVVPPG